MDPLRIYRPELETLVSGGETLRAAVHCRLAIGSDQLEMSPDEMEALLGLLPRGLRDKAVAALRAEPRPEKAWERVVGVLMGADSIIRFDVEKALGGVSAAGHVGSCAARLATALKDMSNVHCVVTDQRLILTELDFDPVVFKPRAELPIGAVLRARRAGKFMQRGRVVLDFVDLSRLALMTGLLFTARADVMVAAFSGHPGPAEGR